MKKKILAVLLLVSIFAAFAGQVYAISSEGDEINIHVPESIFVKRIEIFTAWQMKSYLDISEGRYGYTYAGRIPLRSFKESFVDDDGVIHYECIYEGEIMLQTNY